ncbi:hypothetical protein [Acinetobacter pittii]|uniref:hypothetical protein n=1 Tax=Acinetobacter pittii TaxID=48296 RepID=UPI001D18E8B4|nr:hypothetical protein [Acinetobacter pittii]
MTDLNKEREAFETWFTTTDVYKRISHQIQMCGSGRHQDIFTVFQRDDWREENYAQVSVMASWLAWQEKAKAQAVPVWISADIMKPDEGDLVLGISTTKLAKFNVYQVVALDEFDECAINYWMPLPKAPSESGAEG